MEIFWCFCNCRFFCACILKSRLKMCAVNLRARAVICVYAQVRSRTMYSLSAFLMRFFRIALYFIWRLLAFLFWFFLVVLFVIFFLSFFLSFWLSFFLIFLFFLPSYCLVYSFLSFFHLICSSFVYCFCSVCFSVVLLVSFSFFNSFLLCDFISSYFIFFVWDSWLMDLVCSSFASCSWSRDERWAGFQPVVCCVGVGQRNVVKGLWICQLKLHFRNYSHRGHQQEL
jgi:hypothetical protein